MTMLKLLSRNLCISFGQLLKGKNKEALFKISRKKKEIKTNKNMFIYLLEDIKGIGLKNMTVKASRGYCRYVLFPQRLAIPLNPRTLEEKPNLLQNPVSFKKGAIINAQSAINNAIEYISKPFILYVQNLNDLLITPWHLAPLLTIDRKVDFKPENLIFINGFIIKPGIYEILIIHQSGIHSFMPIIVKYQKSTNS